MLGVCDIIRNCNASSLLTAKKIFQEILEIVLHFDAFQQVYVMKALTALASIN